jgi:TolB-like protein/Tfp pilus assembly protein PilF
VAGRLPFEGWNSSEVMASILGEKEPQPLARYSTEAPTELERIVSKALRRNRDERYQTSKDLLLDLKSLKQELEFERKLERSAPPKSASAAVTSEQALTGTVMESAARPTVSKRRLTSTSFHQRNLVIAVAASLIIILVAGAYFYLNRARSAAINSVAVLPFVNLNSDPDTEYLSDGITDNIIERLSQPPNLKVMSHSAVFHYKGGDTDARAIGRELGVEALLTGRLVKRNDALTINLELVDAQDNSHIWGEQYDRKLSDLLAVQREIPLDVSDKLRLRLSGESKERLARAYTGNSEAYQLYLKGRMSWERWTLDGTKKAIEYFQEAIQKDPNYALAYSGLADAYTNAPYGTGLPPQETRRGARDAANRALALDPMLGEPHAALAEVLLNEEWNFAGAEREFKRAIELSPSYAEAHHLYSHLLLHIGRIDESLAESRKFLELDPLSTAPNLHLGYHYLYARQYDLSLQQHLKTLEMDPNSARVHDQLGDTYYQKGMFDEAVGEYLKEEALIGTAPEDITALKEAYTASGIRGYLQKHIEQFIALRARQGQGLTVEIAAGYGRLGDKDRTFEWLEKAYAEHDSLLVYLREEFSFDNVRSDPRFADLLRGIGLPPP